MSTLKLRGAYALVMHEVFELARVILEERAGAEDVQFAFKLKKLGDAILDRSVALRLEETREAIAQKEAIEKTGLVIVHAVEQGHSLCNFGEGFPSGTTPNQWPEGHRWLTVEAFETATFRAGAVACADCHGILRKRIAKKEAEGMIVVHVLNSGGASVCGIGDGDPPERWPARHVHKAILIQDIERGLKAFRDENGIVLELFGKNGVGCSDCLAAIRRKNNDPGSPFP